MTRLVSARPRPSNRPSKTYPLELVVGGEDAGPLPISLVEAEGLIEDLERGIEEVTNHYVQVRYASGGVLYTYRDPSGTLEVGDLVEVPVTYGTKVGTVKKIGRDYDGEVKDVAARLSREEL